MYNCPHCGKPLIDKANIKERQDAFFNKIVPFVEEFGKDTCRAFYDYWTEKNENGKKMRFEMQKVFEIRKRLQTWKRNEKGSFGGVRKKTNLDTLAEAYHDNSLHEKYLREEMEEQNKEL